VEVHWQQGEGAPVPEAGSGKVFVVARRPQAPPVGIDLNVSPHRWSADVSFAGLSEAVLVFDLHLDGRDVRVLAPWHRR
jgi:hypothetical protein